MSKLTAARCREKISEYEGFEKRGTLTESGRETHQALIIALSVLEKEEDEGEWIEWYGESDNPKLLNKARVDLKFRDGDILHNMDLNWRWKWEEDDLRGSDIVAYRTHLTHSPLFGLILV